MTLILQIATGVCAGIWFAMGLEWLWIEFTHAIRKRK